MMERYKFVSYSKKLGKLNDTTGLTFYEIQDTWNNDKPVIIYYKNPEYKDDFDIQHLLNNNILFDIDEILNMDKPSKLIEEILTKHFKLMCELWVNVIYNKNNGSLLIQIDTEEENLNEYTDNELHNIIKNVLRVPKYEVVMINREYYYYHKGGVW